MDRRFLAVLLATVSFVSCTTLGEFDPDGEAHDLSLGRDATRSRDGSVEQLAVLDVADSGALGDSFADVRTASDGNDSAPGPTVDAGAGPTTVWPFTPLTPAERTSSKRKVYAHRHLFPISMDNQPPAQRHQPLSHRWAWKPARDDLSGRRVAARVDRPETRSNPDLRDG